jgi:tripartite-type tricarboxylate transporter receptor subunit TctC
VRRRFPKWVVLAAAAAANAVQAAEGLPAKPVRVVTALPAGADAYVRVLAARFSEQVGQPVVVENRPGAAFVTAARAVSGAPADGSTVLIYSVMFLIVKNVQPSLAFDPIADFTPVAKIYGDGASMLLVRPESPLRSVQELVGQAKASPGKLTHGGQVAASAHLNAASFLAVAGVKGFHIPYKGATDEIAALLRGDVDFTFMATTVALPYVVSGKLRALGVTSAARVRPLPDVPTLREVLKNDLLVQDNWSGLAVPAKTPAEVVARWHAETVKALGDPLLLKAIEAGGNQPGAGESPEQFAAFARRENDKWRDIVKLTGIKVD